jgi:hypothetical protein
MKHTFYTFDTYATSNTFDTTNRGVAIIDTSELTNCVLLENWYILIPNLETAEKSRQWRDSCRASTSSALLLSNPALCGTCPAICGIALLLQNHFFSIL